MRIDHTAPITDHSSHDALHLALDYLRKEKAMEHTSWAPRYHAFFKSQWGEGPGRGVNEIDGLDIAFGKVGDFGPVEATKAHRAAEVYWYFRNTGLSLEEERPKVPLATRVKNRVIDLATPDKKD